MLHSLMRKSISNYETNELLGELLKRGDIPIYPGNEEEEIKLALFKKVWHHFSVIELQTLFDRQLKLKNG